MTNNNHSASGGSISSSGYGGSFNNDASLVDTSAALAMAANSNSNKVLTKTDRAAGLSYNAIMPPAGGGSHGNELVVIKKLIHHRVPTIDVNAIDDGADQVGGAGNGGNTGAGTSGGIGEDIVGDDTALDHFNNNNNDLLQEDQYVQSVDNTLGEYD